MVEEKQIALSDSTFLIGISMIQRWDLLSEFFEKIYVAPAVWQEVVEQGAGRPGTKELQESNLVEEHPLQNPKNAEMLRVFLGSGESETLVLAQEIAPSITFLDDLKARKVAESIGLFHMGIAGFLLMAKQTNLIEKVRPLLEELKQKGFRLSDKLIETICREAGEE